MKNYMLVKQPVADLGQWRKAFDEMKPHRQAYGLTDIGQFHAADEPDTVIVLLEYADLERAKAYWHSDVLAEGRKKAGVSGPLLAPPEQVWLTDGLVE